MSGIGAALREARSRARIEIAQVEAQTKIRAKYLRALENEEWELLPGPTYVKSFLRTYGDAVGLDGRGLVADYKRSYEAHHVGDDAPLMGRGPVGSEPRSFRLLLLVATVAVLAAAAVAWQMTRPSASPQSPDASTPPAAVPAPTTSSTSPANARQAGVVEVDLVASRTVTVCARAGERVLVRQRELKPGQRATALRGQSILVTVSGPGIQLRVDGTPRTLPASTNAAQSFTVSASGIRKAPTGVTACRS